MVFDPWPMSKLEVHSTIYDGKILNLWTTKPCFETIHGLLVSVFDKVSKPKLSRFMAQSHRIICNMPCFRNAKIVQKRKEQVIYFFRVTSRRQRGLFVYQITLKTFRMRQSYHSLKFNNILKILK